MPEIVPFRALRYDGNHVGSLADVLAPPRQSLDERQRDALYKQHPANVVRIAWNREEPGDEIDEPYQRAAEFVRTWRKQGVLTLDPTPAVYLVQQSRQNGGAPFCRHGLLACVKLDAFDQSGVAKEASLLQSADEDSPHQDSPHQELQKLVAATRLNVQPLVAAVTGDGDGDEGGDGDEDGDEVWQRLEACRETSPAATCLSAEGIRYSVWPIAETASIQAIDRCWEALPVQLLRGHSLLQALLEFRRHLEEIEGGLPQEHPANFGMTMLCRPAAGDDVGGPSDVSPQWPNGLALRLLE